MRELLLDEIATLPVWEGREVTEETNIKELEWLERTELEIDLESHFKLGIPFPRFDNFQTVGNIIDYLIYCGYGKEEKQHP